ncbi:hypothetical protein YDYSG_20650 [Paenibacillus tyrfis]|uniref:DUF3298 and DUF4163 domain-containing protein n=1 Tax=Paenibacillus tyrfis TaxID=1501230 RepID=UPI00249083AA|nr:DUF3298 and DUF4163 domain-containing protein [Paenibacillus tyrfis]GLI06035.1 hypothetical protein YDYSG_20650 [Paenibacillus tyrfis]
MEWEEYERARRERIVTRRLTKPRLDVKYPQVLGLQNRLVQRIVNHSILDAIYKLVRKQDYVQDQTRTVSGSYKVKLHKNGLLSLLYDVYGYSQGAAHGLAYQSSQTFNLRDGREYQLKDLFKPGSDYVRRLSAIIRRRFKEQDIPMIAEFRSIRPDQDFYLTDRAIGIYFQLYEYTPYAYGFPTFEIPFTEVADILDPNGPVALLAYR